MLGREGSLLISSSVTGTTTQTKRSQFSSSSAMTQDCGEKSKGSRPKEQRGEFWTSNPSRGEGRVEGKMGGRGPRRRRERLIRFRLTGRSSSIPNGSSSTLKKLGRLLGNRVDRLGCREVGRREGVSVRSEAHSAPSPSPSSLSLSLLLPLAKPSERVRQDNVLTDGVNDSLLSDGLVGLEVGRGDGEESSGGGGSNGSESGSSSDEREDHS